MPDDRLWTPSEVERAHELVVALMRDRSTGINTTVKLGGGLLVGLLPDASADCRRDIERALADAGLSGIASFGHSVPLSLE